MERTSDGAVSLTEAERGVLEHVRAGELDAEIAVRLGVPIGDVKARVESLSRKLGVRERAELLHAREPVASPPDAASPQRPAAEVAAVDLGSIGRPRRERRGPRLALVAAAAGMLALAAGGFLLFRGDERDPPQAGPTLAETPGGDAAGDANTPAAAAPGIAPLRVGDGVPLPAGSAMYLLVACQDCGQQFTELRRVWQRDARSADNELLYRAPPGSYIDSVVVAPGGFEMAMAVCLQRSCSNITDSGSTKTTLYRSLDGGVSWTEAAVLDAVYSVRDLRDSRATLWRRGPRDESEFAVFDLEANSLQRLLPPEPLAWPLGSSLWATPGESSRVLYASGEVALDREVEGVRQFVAAGSAGGKGLWAQWVLTRSPGRDGPYMGLRDNEGRFYAWKLEAMTLVTGALSEDITFGYSAGRLSLFALKAGYVYPLVGPLGALGYADGQALPLYIAPGPFVRVTGANTSPDDCLNVRVNPVVGANVLGCFKEGTLLRLADGHTSSLVANTAPWYPVITPDGRGGWASGEFLVVP